MALQKEIELESGIVVTYHRITSFNKITNVSNIIEVSSYTTEGKRKDEKEYYNSEKEDKAMDIFIETEYINKEYDENETIKDAYDYLKTLDKYKNSEDV